MPCLLDETFLLGQNSSQAVNLKVNHYVEIRIIETNNLLMHK